MKNRIEWIDTIKAIGIFLVFYGHYVESLYYLEGDSGVTYVQYKFIYSFHIPLFFIVSGFTAKQQRVSLIFIRKIFFQRLIPVFSFAILFVPLWLIYNRFKGEGMIRTVVEKGFAYLGGQPQLNFMTWFLICLFTTEFIATCSGIDLRKKTRNVVIGSGLILAGYLITDNIVSIAIYTRLALNFWFLHESIIALGFYLIGNSTYTLLTSLSAYNKNIFYVALSVSLAFIWLSATYLYEPDIVIMSLSKHGTFVSFFTNALLGSAFIISIGLLIPPNKVTNYLGANTLILLGLNGAFFHFINSYIAKWSLTEHSWWYITFNCTLTTIISLLICVPFVTIINRYFPQFFGKPDADGPLLKPLHTYAVFRFLQAKEPDLLHDTQLTSGFKDVVPNKP
ncbi:acyltransferase family protein [Arsenicibacter rosenii]|uniref:Acyltransferase 3 domain-containing protein n=1 Tax=Arsenicibacter rosenii TaxID=1750698 RepID=A0A1S2VMS9_9BACT|nr:acyltransferase family protein [Arsenicibacter rosenii]OIN59505.1 hypothetical protein BLX24_11110 [Arsenicibacter rosenii]